MENISRLNSILDQIEKLDYETRLYLMERLAKQLRISKGNKTSQQTKLSDLNGLGSEIWSGIEPDKYIHQLRQSD